MNIKLEILRLPLDTVLGAYAWATGLSAQGNTPAERKTFAAEALTAGVQQGLYKVSDLAQMGAVTQPCQQSVPTDAAAVAAIAAVANRAESTALDATTSINTLTKAVDALIKVQTSTTETFKHRLDGLAESASHQVDPKSVNKAIAQIVADAFKPIAAAVKGTTAQTMVTDLTVCVERSVPCVDVFDVAVCDRLGAPLMVDIWNDPTAPAIDPNFIWSAEILQHLLLASETGENLWFGGAKGTGKSETARQFAARTGRAFKRINFHKYTAAEDYVGAVGLEAGKTVFKRGDFLTAFVHPSTVILLDEVTNADAGELAPLNGFLEPNSAVSWGGSVHTRANGVLVFAADNTLGNGDDSGRYAGTRMMNSALVDRFARVIQFDYLPLEAEVEAVVRHTKCHPLLARHVLEAVQVCRAKVNTGEVIDAPSIRSVIAFVRALRLLTTDKAWASTMVARQPAESAPALAAVFASCIREATINQYL